MQILQLSTRVKETHTTVPHLHNMVYYRTGYAERKLIIVNNSSASFVIIDFHFFLNFNHKLCSTEFLVHILKCVNF